MKIFSPWLRWGAFIGMLLLIFAGSIFWIENDQKPLATAISIMFAALGLIFSFIQIFPIGQPDYSHVPAPVSSGRQAIMPQPSTSSLPSATTTQKLPPQECPLQARNPAVHQEDCGEAPQIGHFYGRKREMTLLRQWLLVDSCRLITVLGMGGLGKTTLVTQLATQTKETFTYIFWRSLHNAPPLKDILGSYLHFFSGLPQTELPQEAEDQLSLLIDSFRQYRCLIILDNVESILQEGRSAGQYRPGYEDYGQLLQRVGETQHRSCLILTSREKPREVARLEGSASPVRTLQMTGIDTEEGRELLQESGLFGDAAAWTTLVARYSGNPLALKLATEPIREVFGGDIARFLQEDKSVFGDIHALFDQQFRRLAPLEQKILYWLAIERTPISLEELQAEMIPQEPKGALFEALASLRRRSMVETSGSAHFTLQAVIVEYLTDEIVNHVYEEIQTEQLELFANHALMKAHARYDIRASQQRLLLTPLLQRFLTQLGKEGMEQKLGHILDLLRDTPTYANSYAAGNILNLLVLAQCNLSQFNFSQLTVRQAYLQNVTLTDVNFAHANLTSSVFTDTFSGVLSIAFSPDGSRLVAGTANGEIRIWQATTGKWLSLCQGHTDAVWSVTFSPDGALMASGSQDQTIRLWDSNTGQCLHVLQEQRTRIWSVAFNKDGTQLVSAGDDQLLHVWDTNTGEQIHTFAGHTHRIRAVAWNPTRNLFASASEDQTIRIWEANTGSCLYVLQEHTASLRAVAFRPDGKLIASAGDDHTVRLWDVDTGQCLKTLTGHTNRVRSLAFDANGTQLASGSDDQTVRLWDVDTGQCLKTMQRHTNRVWSVAFHPNSSVVASGSDDQTIHVWDVHSGYDQYTLYGYTTWIWSIAFHPGGQLLASSDQAIHLWDVKTQRPTQTLQGHANRVRTVTFSPDGKTIASGSEDHTVRLWNTQTGKALHILMGHTNWVRMVAFHPNGILLASGSDDRSIRLWDSNTGQCLRILQGHTREIRTVAFSPDGRLLASGGVDCTIQLWDVDTGHIRDTLHGHSQRIRAIAFSPNGKLLASGGADQTIRLWNSSTGQCLHILREHTHDIRSLAFSPDGRLLASSSEDQAIYLWNTANLHIEQILHGHENRIRSIAFTSNGCELASGSDDGTIKFWNVRDGLCLRTLRSDRPYERMNITGITGLSEVQKSSLRLLGAIE